MAQMGNTSTIAGLYIHPGKSFKWGLLSGFFSPTFTSSLFPVILEGPQSRHRTTTSNNLKRKFPQQEEKKKKNKKKKTTNMT
jgi:hypothetical protein